MSIAVIKTGGKQYVVSEGQTITIEKVLIKEGEPVSFETLLTSDEGAQKMEIGAPLVATKVTGRVMKHQLDDKVSVVKYQAKTRYRRRVGHRQNITKVKIEKI